MDNHKKPQDNRSLNAPRKRIASRWAGAGIIAACVLAFYWIPLCSESASIQWDAVDLHYPFQKYFSDHIRAGNLPSWTPYLCAGYPFLAYPETGAWYLPHWPFFLLGITPRMIQCELALNAFLACCGAFLLISWFVESRSAAIVGGLCYGLSGFFTGHAEHVSIFAAASTVPWVLLAYRRALDGTPVRYAALGGLAGAQMILAGYFQTAMYGFLVLGLFAVAEVCRKRERWLPAILVLTGIFAIAVTVSAIHVLPAREFTWDSIRSSADFSQLPTARSADGSESPLGLLQMEPLATLFAPDWLGLISLHYRGPADATQYYFYAGLLLLPLAAAGLAHSRVRWHGLLLIVPAFWFMLGPAAGLFRLAMSLPLMNKVRAPVQGWFVVALGLALLAAGGLDWILQRWRVRYVGSAIVLLLLGDLWYWNSWRNPLAYGRSSYQTLYGATEEAVKQQIAPAVRPLTRLDFTGNVGIHPQDFPLNLRVETTVGYAALQISEYIAYRHTMDHNPKLMNGLNVGVFVSPDPLTLHANPTVLPRAFFPKSAVDATSRADARAKLATLDPAEQAIVLGPHDPIQQDPGATASVVAYDETSYRIRYRAASPSLLRLSVPFYPGWRATIEGKALPLLRVDLALMGVVVPAGERELSFDFRSETIRWGAAISIAGWIVALLLVTPGIGSRRRKASQ